MKTLKINHVYFLILVVSTTIDASRILYFPLTKLHSSHKQIEKPISDEFIPPSVSEQEEIEKRGDNFDWETLVNQQSINDQQINDENLLPESLKQFDNVDGRAERLQSNMELNFIEKKNRRNDTLFLIIVGACCLVGVVGLIGAAFFWYKIQKKAETAVETEYPSYGVTGPNSSGAKISPSSTMSDRKLAQSAQMFHYQQQRQQMMAQEKAHLDAKPVHSDDSDDETHGGGDYTVYECPGLAPTGEMEVRNPLFNEPDSTSKLHPQLSTSP